jgi:hypothetical protein
VTGYIARALGIGRRFWPDARIALLAAYDEPYATFTANVAEAMIFPSAGDALDFTLQVYTADPVREDGKPNRPLSGYFWEFAPAETLEDRLNAEVVP